MYFTDAYGRDNRPQWKRYGSHERDCLCDRCIANYNSHNTNRAGGCGCADCMHTRTLIAVQAEKAAASQVPPVDINGGRITDKTARRLRGKGSSGMASVNICSRKGCQAFMTGEAVARIEIMGTVNRGKASDIVLEICPACAGDLIDVIEAGPFTPRQKAYDKPYERSGETDAIENATAEQLAAALMEKLMKSQRSIEGKTE